MEKQQQFNLSYILSFILHPLLMLSYSICFLFGYTDFRFILAGQFWALLLPIFSLSVGIPLASLYFIRKAGIIADYSLSNRKNRLIIFLVTFIPYFLLSYSIAQSKLYIWFTALFCIPLIILLICGIRGVWRKTSMHMAGMGGLIGVVLSICYNVKGLNPYFLFIILFILAGSLATSRLLNEKDTPAQVYSGFGIGLATGYLCIAGAMKFVYLYLRYIYF